MAKFKDDDAPTFQNGDRIGPDFDFTKTEFGYADLKDADFDEHDLSQASLDRTEQLPAAKGIARECEVAKMTGAHEMAMLRCMNQTYIECFYGANWIFKGIAYILGFIFSKNPFKLDTLDYKVGHRRASACFESVPVPV